MEYKNINELKVPRLILKSFEIDKSMYRIRRKRVATVYLEDLKRPGPFGNGKGNLFFDEFAWRRSNSAPASVKMIKEFISPILIREGIDAPLTVRWNKYAGCSMCSCSPGYSITVKRPYLKMPYHIRLGWTFINHEVSRRR